VNEHRDASDRLTIDFEKIESRQYAKITKAIVKQFELKPANEITRGLDEIFQDYQQGEKIIGLEWDNWSGYIVNAKNTIAEDLAREIASYINDTYKNS